MIVAVTGVPPPPPPTAAAAGGPGDPAGLQGPGVGHARRDAFQIARRGVTGAALGGEIFLAGRGVTDERVRKRRLARRRCPLRATGGLQAVQVLRHGLDVLVGHRNRRHAAFGACALHDRHDQLAGLIVQHQLGAQEVRAAKLAAARVHAVAGAADRRVKRLAALDERRVARRALLRGKRRHASSPLRRSLSTAGGRCRRGRRLWRGCRGLRRRRGRLLRGHGAEQHDEGGRCGRHDSLDSHLYPFLMATRHVPHLSVASDGQFEYIVVERATRSR